jgi:PAS domain S-box-containing protein
MDNLLKPEKQAVMGPDEPRLQNASSHVSSSLYQKSAVNREGTHGSVAIQRENCPCGTTFSEEAIPELRAIWKEFALIPKRLMHFDFGVIGCFITDQNAVIKGVSPVNEEALGYESGHLIGKSLLRYVSPKSRDILMLHLLGLLEGINSSVEISFLTANGQEVPVMLKSFPVQCNLYGDTETCYWASMTIFDWKKPETVLEENSHRLEEVFADLQENLQRMIQRERMQALERMASGIAHKFNNLLSPILGFSEVLLAYPDKLADTEKVTQHLKMIRSAALEAKDVIRRLGEFYHRRKASDFCESINLNSLVEEVAAFARARWGSSAEKVVPQGQFSLQEGQPAIRIRKDLADDLPSIAGVEVELREAMVSLITNAIEAMPKGGTLTLRTRALNNNVLLEVGDTGVGMTEEVQKRCMDPFFSTKAGAGLGLSIVSGVVQRHNGLLKIMSQPEQGTTFLIYFPVQAP